MRPHGHPMHVEPQTDRDHALAVRAGSSDSVHLALREACSSSSPRVRDDCRLIVGGTDWLVVENELRPIPRGTEPLEPLSGVRFKSARVHQSEGPVNADRAFVVVQAPRNAARSTAVSAGSTARPSRAEATAASSTAITATAWSGVAASLLGRPRIASRTPV